MIKERRELEANENDYYNPELKMAFLEDIEGDITRKIFSSKLSIISKEEHLKGKDLYDMSLREIKDVMYALTATTSTASYGNAIKIKDYIDWMFDHGYKTSNLNPFDSVIDMVEWSKQFVITFRRSFFTRRDILDMCNSLYNYVDKALLLGMFEGINGKGYSEILNLQAKDVTETNDKFYVNLVDNEENKRTIEISAVLANYIKAADQEMKYTSSNGEDMQGLLSESHYIDSPYVFKKSRKGRQDRELDGFFIQRKMILFKEFFGIEYMRAREVRYSGIMEMANEITGNKEVKLTKELADMIGEQFDMPTTLMNGLRYRNRTTLNRILEVPEFEEMYGYKINL